MVQQQGLLEHCAMGGRWGLATFDNLPDKLPDYGAPVAAVPQPIPGHSSSSSLTQCLCCMRVPRAGAALQQEAALKAQREKMLKVGPGAALQPHAWLCMIFGTGGLKWQKHL